MELVKASKKNNKTKLDSLKTFYKRKTKKFFSARQLVEFAETMTQVMLHPAAQLSHPTFQTTSSSLYESICLSGTGAESLLCKSQLSVKSFHLSPKCILVIWIFYSPGYKNKNKKM